MATTLNRTRVITPIAEKFLVQWLSDAQQTELKNVTGLWSYKELVSFGTTVLPLLFQQMLSYREQGDKRVLYILFPIRDILKADPLSFRTMDEACDTVDRWLRWGKAHHYLDPVS